MSNLKQCDRCERRVRLITSVGIRNPALDGWRVLHATEIDAAGQAFESRELCKICVEQLHRFLSGHEIARVICSDDEENPA